MGRMNWSRIATRDRMRRHGVEDVKGKMPVVIDPTPKVCRRKLSKAELREQAEAAFLAWRAGQAAYFIPTTIESGPTLSLIHI